MNVSSGNPSPSLTTPSSVNKHLRVRQKIVGHLAKTKVTAASNANAKAINAAAEHHNANSKTAANDQQQTVKAMANAGAAAAPVLPANVLDNNSDLALLAVSVRVDSFRDHLTPRLCVEPC